MTVRGPLRLVRAEERVANARVEKLAQLRWHLAHAALLAKELGWEAVPFVHEARAVFAATKRRR